MWVKAVAEAVLEIVRQIKATASASGAPALTHVPEIVGTSACFRHALEDLDELMHLPYGLVTGEPGVGKMFLIRALWRQIGGSARPIILPCGSFFKDYYVAGSRRRFGGGRGAVDELTPYLNEADKGLLVLHHVEELPMAVQEEIAVRLPSSAAGPGAAGRLVGVDREGLLERDVKLLATSRFPPEMLEQTGRVVPELALKLRGRHVRIPSLAERGREDTEQLCQDMVRQIAMRRGMAAPPRVAPEVVRALGQASWPNNISDLLRVLEHAVGRCRGGTIGMEHLPKGLYARSTAPQTLKEVVARAQRTAIENALDQTGGRVAEAAKMLGVPTGSLYRTMRRLGMKPG